MNVPSVQQHERTFCATTTDINVPCAATADTNAPSVQQQRTRTNLPRTRTYLLCNNMSARRAVSGESAAAPGAFLTGANSSSRNTSNRTAFLAIGNVSKIKSSSLIPYPPARPNPNLCEHITDTLPNTKWQCVLDTKARRGDRQKCMSHHCDVLVKPKVQCLCKSTNSEPYL